MRVKRFAIIALITLIVAVTLGATIIPARAEVKPMQVMNYPALSLSNGIVGYWKLDESNGTRYDFVGTNNLTSNNNVSQAPGKHNFGAQLSYANTSYLSVADNAFLSGCNCDITVAAWVYLDTKTTDKFIVSQWETVGNLGYALYYDTALNVFRFSTSSNGSDYYFVSDTHQVSVGTWYLVIGGYDSIGDRLFIQTNDYGIETISNSLGVYNSSAAWWVGYDTGATLDGRIDSLGVWKKFLQPAERSALWNS